MKHGSLVLHPHLTNFTQASGAIAVSSGVTRGKIFSELGSVYHPCSVGESAEGSGLILPFMIAAARCARRTFS